MSPRGARNGKVAQVVLLPPTQSELYRTEIERVVSAFVPGTAVTRYGRTWLMGQSRVDGLYLFGRIGFESEGSVTEVWDEDRTDFTQLAIPSGVTAPFLLALTTLKMAFQTRGSLIKVNSFIHAMQALLKESTGEDWRLVTSRRVVTFEQWRDSVQKVTRMRFHLVRPNPNYEGRPDVERLLEEIGAEAETLEVQNPDGLQTDADLVGQLLDHVGRGYGDATITGERQEDDRVVETVYDTRLGGESELHERPADATGEVPESELRAELTADDYADDSE
jgi:hypothetical protein